jgi:maltooligosyltrehalose trehalohydrolase
LLAPCVPLIFMGQEYGEQRPFLYFVDHTDGDLLAATREGRAREFAAFAGQGAPPDPGEEDTFRRSVLERPRHGVATPELELTRRLLAARREYDCFRPARSGEREVALKAWSDGTCIGYRARGRKTVGLVAANLSSEPAVLGSVDGAGDDSAFADLTDLRPVLSLDAGRLVGDTAFSAPALDPTAGVRLGPWQVVAAVGRLQGDG